MSGERFPKIDSGKSTQEQARLGSLENPIIDSNMTKKEALRPNPNVKIPPEIFKMQVLIPVKYLSFDRKYHQGQIVVDKRLQKDVEDFFEFLIKEQFPINKVVPVAHDDYNFDDDKSMRANNSSGFNPRFIANTIKPSKHGMGWAIDINPMLSPYFGGPGSKTPVTPVNSLEEENVRELSEYVDSKKEEGEEELEFEYYNIDKPGTITPWIADFLKKRGWTWGLEWYKDEDNPRADIHHFEKTFGEIPQFEQEES